MAQKTINLATEIFILFLVGMVLMLAWRIGQEKNYSGETRNRLIQLEERVKYQETKVSRIDHNLYNKIMTDEESEWIEESLKYVQDTIGCDCMFYSFESYGVVFEHPQSVTGDPAYIYVDIDRKLIERNYTPKF